MRTPQQIIDPPTPATILAAAAWAPATAVALYLFGLASNGAGPTLVLGFIVNCVLSIPAASEIYAWAINRTPN